MKVLGMVKSSLIDFPQKASTVLFLGGCNFRCSYCHNPDIVNGRGEALNVDEILGFLEKRKKYLDGVVISGGEPTLHSDLRELILRIRALGYAIKLDTNGTRPDMIKSLIDDGLLDYIAMDIKAPWSKYTDVICVPEGNGVNISLIRESVRIIMDSDVDYEFRTTLCRELFNEDDILQMAEMVRGAKKYCLQRFRDPGEVLGDHTALSAFSEAEMRALAAIAGRYVDCVAVR